MFNYDEILIYCNVRIEKRTLKYQYGFLKIIRKISWTVDNGKTNPLIH